MEPTSGDLLLNTLTTRYGRLAVFANDIGAVTQSLQEYGEWAENELTFVHALIREGSTVVDVGAYVGTHTMAFSRFVGPSGRVVSIEPQAPAFRLLTLNVASNELLNVDISQAVASSAEGELVIPSIEIGQKASFGSVSLLGEFLRNSGEGCSDTTYPGSPGGTTVPVITVDSLKLDQCALIKIDAEGMEGLVLQGALMTLERCKPIIYAEFNSVDAGLMTFGQLRAAGYRVKAHVVEAFNPDNFRGVSKNLFGNARETALVGIPVPALKGIEEYQIRDIELLLDIETADDLSLALMNKPQYPKEVLLRGAAAKTGGSRCLEEADAIRAEAETLRRDVVHLRSYIEVELKNAQHETEEVRKTFNLQLVTERKDLGQTRRALDEEIQKTAIARDEMQLVQQALDEEIQKAAIAQDELRLGRQALDLRNLQLSAARQELQRVETAFSAKIDACMYQISIMHKEIQHLKNMFRHQADSAAAALAAVYDSTSWRMTAPARALSTLIRLKVNAWIRKQR